MVEDNAMNGGARCANPACDRRDIRARGRCPACYAFYRRHGRDATRAEMRRRDRPQTLCKVCGRAYAQARGRCMTCYHYWWRTGRDRPMDGAGGEGLCAVCGERPVYRQDRCRSCYAYLQSRGHDRAMREER
ncbi:MAG: hypothetical protein ACOC9X_02610 [bacterium]